MRRLILVVIFMASLGGDLFAAAIDVQLKSRSGETLEGQLSWAGRPIEPIDRLLAYRPPSVGQSEPFRLSIFGVRVVGPEQPSAKSVTIPWGWVARIEPTVGRAPDVRIVTHGGTELFLREGDLMRSQTLMLTANNAAPQLLTLDSIEWIDLKPDATQKPLSDRLYGRVVWDSGSMEGWIEWDQDEREISDRLDGDSLSGERQSLEFVTIEKIVRVDTESSDVTLEDGTTRRLFATNDVAQGHRGVTVESPTERVELPWRAVRLVEFYRPARETQAVQLDPVSDERLRGVVCTRDGRQLQGLMDWDLDERYLFETLEGTAARSVDYAIRFDAIAEVASISGRGSYVRLRDGRELDLFSRGDVASHHRGIRLGDREPLSWYEVERVLFANSAEELSELTQGAPCGKR
jgi:hypothetical protein